MNAAEAIEIPEAFPTGAAPNYLINLALQKFGVADSRDLGARIGIAIEDLVFGFPFPDGVRFIKGSKLERFDSDAYIGYIRLDKADPYKAETDANTLVPLTAHLKAKMPFASIKFDRANGFISVVISYCHLEKLFGDARSIRTKRIGDIAEEAADAVGDAVCPGPIKITN
ncbi:MAG: hypothetical protein UT33_C0008G0037 [Candidatus Peregrinibacteria bacterium GW2011_GWC2_39_14]|nr:MAG: hypothetical protein US92_C0004G0037 [Candidatus Peregrinibacteria bacterium GW2011_GWA2_38_36]KKR06721.1 MAG: hypothetical protein UT33_C0008G0037 [Candidatus Peregrinibacteria bacterium GW2011_GWC2_39_14]